MSLAWRGDHTRSTGGNHFSAGGQSVDVFTIKGHRWMASPGTCADGVECPFESWVCETSFLAEFGSKCLSTKSKVSPYLGFLNEPDFPKISGWVCGQFFFGWWAIRGCTAYSGEQLSAIHWSQRVHYLAQNWILWFWNSCAEQALEWTDPKHPRTTVAQN